MKTFNTLIALLLFAGSAVAAESVQWLPPAANDLRAVELAGPDLEVPSSRHSENAPVQFAWAAESGRSESPNGSAHRVESRQYWVDTTGRALARGIKLPVSAPGAVIRVSALTQGSGLMLDADSLQLAVDGREVAVTGDPSAALSAAHVVTGSKLRDQGLSVPDSSLAFRLPEQSGAGTVQMRVAGAADDQPLVVHVYEPDSPWVARLSTARLNFLSGQELDFEVELTNGEHSIAAGSVEAMLVSPDAAEAWSLESHAAGSKLSGAAPGNGRSSDRGLYETHVYVNGRHGDTLIRRDLKLAVNIAPPLGRLTERAEVGFGDTMSIDVGVAVMTAGRYQLNAEIHGTNALGETEPVAYTQSAAVLQAGEESITLEVPLALVDGSGLQAPFEVRNLELLDQGRMYQLEHRSRAMVIGSANDRSPGDTIER